MPEEGAAYDHTHPLVRGTASGTSTERAVAVASTRVADSAMRGKRNAEE